MRHHLLFILLIGSFGAGLRAGGIEDMYAAATTIIRNQRSQGYELLQMVCEGLELEESRKTISARLSDEYEYFVWVQTTSELREFELKITKDDNIAVLEEASNRHTRTLTGLPGGLYIVGVRGTSYANNSRLGYFGLVLMRRLVIRRGQPGQPIGTNPTVGTGTGTVPTPVGGASTPRGGDVWTMDCSFSQLEKLSRNIKESRIEEPGNSTNYRDYQAKLKIDSDVSEVSIKPRQSSNFTYRVVDKQCHVATGEKRLELEDAQHTRYYMIINFNRGTISLQPKGSDRQIIYRD